jgi:hypothetical protein
VQALLLRRPTNIAIVELSNKLVEHGNHLNVPEEPEMDGYPIDPQFRQRYGPRGVLHCVATAIEQLDEDPRFGKWGKHKCKDTGQLTRKTMEHC